MHFIIIVLSLSWLSLFTDALPVPREFVNLFITTSTLIYSVWFGCRMRITLPLDYVLLWVIVTISFLIGSVYWGVASGLMFYLRYCSYILLIIIVTQRGLNRKPFKLLVFIVLLTLASAFGGVITDNYQFLNGYNRFKGLSASPVALALACTVCILFYLQFLKNGRIQFNIAHLPFIALLLYFLLASGSRQPVAGLLLIAVYSIYFSLSFGTKLFFTAVIVIPSAYFVVVNIETVVQSSRAVMQIYQLVSGDSNALADSSSTARLGYIIAVMAYLDETLYIFPNGINSFPYIYQEVTGADQKIAFHNDILLPLVEHGPILGLIAIGIILNRIKKASQMGSSVIVPVAGFIFAMSLNNVFYYNFVILTLIVMIFGVHTCSIKKKT